MGLLLSILVTCVGVVELLTFYNNVKRHVNYQPAQTSLTSLKDQYLRELGSVRDRLVTQLHELEKNDIVIPTQVNIPTFRHNNHEDIDVDFYEKIVTRSKSPSPRRYLVEEKNSATSLPTRHFASEEPQALKGIKKSRAQECLPEYLFQEEVTSIVPQYLLKDGDGPVSLPLPEKFVVTENETEVKTDVFRKKMGHNIVEVDGEMYYRRSPSPFPSFDLTAPRNSVCSELLDDSVSVVEVDELSRSNSHSPVDIEVKNESNNILEINKNSEKLDIMLKTSSHNSKEYWDNKGLAVFPKKIKSRSPSSGVLKTRKGDSLTKPNLRRRRSKSESNSDELVSDDHNFSKTTSSLELLEETRNELDFTSENEDNESVEIQMYTEEMKNSLDGVDRGKGCIRRKIIKRKQVKTRSTSKNKTDLTQAIDAGKPADPPSEKTLTTQSGRPFWVNCEKIKIGFDDL